MKTMKDVQKIEVIPSAALIHNRKGVGFMIPILAIGMIGVLGYGAMKGFGWIGEDENTQPQQLTVTTPSGDEKKVVMDPAQKSAMSCDGVQSVNVLHNDLNSFALGTDPGDTLEIIEKDGVFFTQQVADDATTTSVPVLSSYKALAGNTAGAPLANYFAKIVEFDTVCDDVPVQPKLKPASAPTITVVNDNGVTSNSDSNHEAADADSSYTPCLTIKAPANACSSEYGAIVAFEYDATYVKNVDSTDLTNPRDSSFLVAHTTNHSGSGYNMDQYQVMQFDGMLCDGEKAEICFDVETTSSAPGEDEANVQVHWYPMNYDLDADDYSIIGPAIYDEDNNIISQGNTTATYYTA